MRGAAKRHQPKRSTRRTDSVGWARPTRTSYAARRGVSVPPIRVGRAHPTARVRVGGAQPTPPVREGGADSSVSAVWSSERGARSNFPSRFREHLFAVPREEISGGAVARAPGKDDAGGVVGDHARRLAMRLAVAGPTAPAGARRTHVGQTLRCSSCLCCLPLSRHHTPSAVRMARTSPCREVSASPNGRCGMCSVTIAATALAWARSRGLFTGSRPG